MILTPGPPLILHMQLPASYFKKKTYVSLTKIHLWERFSPNLSLPNRLNSGDLAAFSAKSVIPSTTILMARAYIKDIKNYLLKLFLI